MNKWLWPLVIGGLFIGVLMSVKVSEAYITKMAQAIMNFEGWKPGSISMRNNNPGNIKAIPGTIFEVGKSGVTGIDPYSEGQAIFNNFRSGWNALILQLKLAFEGRSSIYFPDDTLYDFFSKYATANQQPYAEFVAKQLGVSPFISLSQLSQKT